MALAAAENLVPVTLELGGKCPAILAADSVDAESVRSVIGTKLIKNGQMCISVDYALVPRGQVDDFVRHAEPTVKDELASYTASGDCTGIITPGTWTGSRRWWPRRGRPARAVVTLGGGATRPPAAAARLVSTRPRACASCRRRSSGRSCRWCPTTTSDDALAGVNAGERPLGLYVYSKDSDVAEGVLRQTTSGGRA